MSLDFFRGVTIMAMILVNNPGDEEAAYWPLQHAQWNGWTSTDLIFPFFLFIVGVAMMFSFSSRLERRDSRTNLMLHVVRRAFILFALGLFLNGFPNHFHAGSIRVYGVLQRIAVCYLMAAALALWTNSRGWIVAIVVCLVGYWLLMRYVPVPGFGVPTRDIPLLDPDRNLVAWLDRKLLMGHLYEKTRDPEGVISTLPAIATVLLGVLTGEWLRTRHSPQRKAAWMLAAGVVGLAAGEFFNIWFPINKKLWTSSFVLFTAGFALVLLALCYWVLDIKQRRGRWTKPVLIFGMNAIAAYGFAELVAHMVDRLTITLSDGKTLSWQQAIYEKTFEHAASPANASLLYAVVYVLMCLAAMWVLYRKHIFLKI
jgi:predicted acyltransferase